MGYITPPVETDPEALLQEAFDALADKLPGWVPSDAHVETWVLEVVTAMVAENRELASAVLTTIYKHWGTDMVNVPPIEATKAIAPTTWTAIDDGGHLVEAGTTVGILNDLGQIIPFEVPEDTPIPPGDTTVAVDLVAVDPGVAGSGLTGGASLIDVRTWVESVSLDGITTRGVDAETDEEYLARLTEELTLLTRTPILPNDFALIYRHIPSVARAIAFDGYDPDDDTEDNERMVAVAGVDENGQPLSTTIKNAAAALLESLRESTFVVNVMDPTYTEIDVDFTATAYPGFDPATVEADAIAAVEDYLSPANWGLPSFGDPGSNAGWVDEPLVRISEISALLNNVDGLHWVDTLEIDGGTTDVTLTAKVNLTEAGDITGAVAGP